MKLQDEVQKLYRQIEEMRSLSMRIANPHLVPKKNRFLTYPTKKIKSKPKTPTETDPIIASEKKHQTEAEVKTVDGKQMMTFKL
jgi:hypothetical protein